MISKVQKLHTRLALTVLISILACGSALAQRLTTGQFDRGEELTYDAEFSRSLLRSVDIAEFRFSATRVPLTTLDSDTTPKQYSLQLVGEIKSKGFFTRLFNLNFVERITSEVEPKSFTVQRTKRYDQQGKRIRSSETIYDRKAGDIIWTEIEPGNSAREPRVVRASFDGEVQDILSVIYFLRTEALDPGRSFQLSVTDSGRIYKVPIRVWEKRTMKTVLGKVETVRLEAKILGAEGIIGSDTQFSIWLTADRRHIPVRARVKSEYGVFDVKLKKMNQGSATSANSLVGK